MPALTVELKFDAAQFRPEVLRLILATSQQRGCSPQEAMEALLDEVAKKEGFTPPPSQQPARVA